MTPFPFVECDEHGRQLGVIVCKHVLSGAPVEHVALASEEHPGEILCAIEEHGDHMDLKLICAEHAMRTFPEYVAEALG